MVRQHDNQKDARTAQPSPRQGLPSAAGMRAFRHFCTPALSRHRAPEHDVLAERARFHLRGAAVERLHTRGGETCVYVLDPYSGTPKASVMLVHGWTSEASFMSAFADFFRRRGLRVVLPDLPAHGASRGRRTSLIDCAHAVLDVAEACGPIRFVVGHSIGGLAALVAGGGRQPMRATAAFEAYVLVGMPDRFVDVTRAFGEELGLHSRAQRTFERRLERLARRSLRDFAGSRLLQEAGRPALVVHARDDAEVAFADAERIVAWSSGAELAPFDNMGHRAILYAPQAVRAAYGFLARLM